MTNAQKLHQEFVRLGGMRHKLKNRMLAILPEICKSGIWKKYAGSIEEYAGKYGDIAGTTVIKRLRLEKNLENKPCLKAAIEKVGVHKVALVAKIATAETDKTFAENISNMSRLAVQSLSKELRLGQAQIKLGVEGVNVNQQLIFSDSGSADQNESQPCRSVPITKKIELDENSTFLFMKLKAKLGKHLSDTEFLKNILEEREKQEFPQKQSKITDKGASPKSITEVSKQNEATTSKKIGSYKSVTGDVFQKIPNQAVEQPKDRSPVAHKEIASRYVPVDKKRQIIAQTNGKCSYPNCNAPFQILHHVDRFSESKSHDSIIPLCTIHHEFSHNNLIHNENLMTEKWELSIIKPPLISPADILYKKYRHKTFA